MFIYFRNRKAEKKIQNETGDTASNAMSVLKEGSNEIAGKKILNPEQEILPLDKYELRDIMLDHLSELHWFYGDLIGVRVARKHLTWYCSSLANADEFRHRVVRVESASEQISLTKDYFDRDGDKREDEGNFLAA